MSNKKHHSAPEAMPQSCASVIAFGEPCGVQLLNYSINNSTPPPLILRQLHSGVAARIHSFNTEKIERLIGVFTFARSEQANSTEFIHSLEANGQIRPNSYIRSKRTGKFDRIYTFAHSERANSTEFIHSLTANGQIRPILYFRLQRTGKFDRIHTFAHSERTNQIYFITNQ